MSTDPRGEILPLLSERQRRSPIALPEDPSDEALLRDWTLTKTHLEEIRRSSRGQDNQIGFALQLCAVRKYGRFVSDFSRPALRIVNHLGKQLGFLPTLFLEYPGREATETEHKRRLATYLGLRAFDSEVERTLQDWVFSEAARGEPGRRLYERAEETLRGWKVILPAPSRLERLVGGVVARRRGDFRDRIAGRLGPDLRRAIDRLLEVPVGQRVSALHSLKAPPPAAKPDAIARLLRTIREFKALGIEGLDFSGVEPDVVAHWAEIAREADAGDLKRLDPETRCARVACLLVEGLRTQTDYAIRMNDQFLVDAWRHARIDFEKEYREYRQRHRVSLETLVEVGSRVVDVPAKGVNTRDLILSEFSEAHLREAIESCRHYLHLEERGLQDAIRARYSRMRQYGRLFLETLDLRGGPGAGPLLEALEFIRAADREGGNLPDDAPVDFIPKPIRPLLYDEEDGALDRHLYEMWFMWALKTALRSGDVFVPASRHHVSFLNLILSDERWERDREKEFAAAPLPLSAAEYLEALGRKYDEQIRETQRLLPGNRFARVEGDRFAFSKDLADPEAASVKDVRRVVMTHMPRARIEDILSRTDDACRWTRHFRSREGRECSPDHEVPLLAAIVAHGTNLGLATMAQSTEGISPDLLDYVSRRYIRVETLKAAIEELVNFHHSLSLTRVWGEGRHASADGQRKAAEGATLDASFYPRYFGYYEKAVTVYTHVSDEHSVFSTQVISCSVREAIYVLDGILENNSVLRPERLSTDTHGYIERVFGVCPLIGLAFMPRIKDLAHQQLYKFDRDARYGSLEPLFRVAVDLDRIREQYDPMVRVAASLKNRTAPAHVILDRLAADSPSDRVGQGFTALGRLQKTIFILRYVSDPDLRRAIHRQLNRGEFRHRLANRLHFGNQGEFATDDYEEIMNKASCLSLLSNAVLVSNTLELDRIVTRLRDQGHQVRDEDLARISPLMHRHVIPNGTYHFRDARAQL